MPKSDNSGSLANFFTPGFDAALNRLGEYLHLPDYPSPRKLADFEKNQYRGRGVVSGWEIKPFNSTSAYSLHVLVDNRYPYTPPRVALSPAPPSLSYPHIESDGFLCLSSMDGAIDHTAIEAAAEETLKRAVRLVEESFAGANVTDFQEEIVSYWGRMTDGKDFYSLLDVSNKTCRQVWVWRGEVFHLIAETQEEALRWLQNKFGATKEWTCELAAFIWREEALFPAEYPDTPAQTYQLVCDSGSNAKQIFGALATAFPSQINIVVGTNTSSGPALLGITLSRPTFNIHSGVTASDHFSRGFRKGALPPDIAAERYTDVRGIAQRSDVQRVDAKWILSRDSSPAMTTLNTKTVTMIGCGAVGSEIARMLIQSGITRLHLIDPDSMEWENIGRHTLGASAMNFRKKQSKVSVLADQLCSQYPHIQIVSTHNRKWEDALRDNDDFLKQTDLVVMTTGEWSADNAMNSLSQAQDKFPPIVYGWTEAFACAGHVVAVLSEGGCFACAFEDRTFRLKVTNFPVEISQTAACGGVFQPFSAVDLAPITAMIAKASLDVLTGDITVSKIRTWVGSQSILQQHKGEWTDLWAGRIKGKGSTSFMHEVNLLPVTDCCKERAEDGQCNIQDQTASQSN